MGHPGCQYGPSLNKPYGAHKGNMGPTSTMWVPYGFCTIDTQVATIWANWDIWVCHGAHGYDIKYPQGPYNMCILMFIYI